jgi:hypothetical protein
VRHLARMSGRFWGETGGRARRPWLRGALLVLLVGVVASGCDWTLAGYDIANTRSSGDTGISTSNVGSLSESLTSNDLNTVVSANGDEMSSVSEASGVLYITAYGYLEAFSATSCPTAPTNCAALWVAPTEFDNAPATTAPVVSNNEVYVSNGGVVLAYSTSDSGCPVVSGTVDCAPQRVYDNSATTAIPADPPLVDNNHLYAASTGKVFSADGSQDCGYKVGWDWPNNTSTEILVCEPVWTYAMPSGYTATSGGTPAIATATSGTYSGKPLIYMNGWENGGYASTFAFDANGSLNCSTAATGTTCSILRWFLTSGTSLGQPPVVANGSLYVEEQYGDGGFIAVYDQNGVNACSYVCAPLYEDETDVPLASAIAVSGSEVLASNGDLLAFNENGCGQSACQPVWQTSATCDGTPSVANGVVYVGVTEPCGTGVNAYNAASGALLRAFVSPDNSTVYYDAPTIANGALYFGTSHNDMYAYSS